MNKKILLIVVLVIFIINLFVLWYFVKPLISGNVVSVDKGFAEKGFVTKVIDGDTVIINGESVRLLGIDADERGYPCYKEAKKRLEELVLNKEVRLEKDAENKDQYKRYLRYIFVDDENVNLKLVEEGFATARFSPQNRKYKKEILGAEQNARGGKIGCVWTLEIDTGKKEDKEEIDSEEEEDSEDEENEDEDSCVALGCPSGTKYAGSLKSDKYHDCDCKWAEKIYEENLNCFKSLSEAQNQDYVACGVCGG